MTWNYKYEKKKIQIDSKKQIDTYIQYIHIDTLSITSLI